MKKRDLVRENAELRRKLDGATVAFEIALDELVKCRQRESELLLGHELVPGSYDRWFRAVDAILGAARARRRLCQTHDTEHLLKNRQD